MTCVSALFYKLCSLARMIQLVFSGMFMKKILQSLIITTLFSFTACSGVKMIKPERKLAEKVDTTKLYKPSFVQKMNEIKDKFRQGKSDIALKDLGAMKEETLNQSE